jgi:hypothetical protein
MFRNFDHARVVLSVQRLHHALEAWSAAMVWAGATLSSIAAPLHKCLAPDDIDPEDDDDIMPELSNRFNIPAEMMCEGAANENYSSARIDFQAWNSSWGQQTSEPDKKNDPDDDD